MPNSHFPNPSGQSGQNRLLDWLNQRTGFRQAAHQALDEPIPGGSRFAYVFGSGLLFLFISQIITGIFLALYYVPSADHAHTTIAYITKVVTAGSFLRSIHAYGASAMIVVLILHLGQTFLYGSYKGRRELLWLAGCILFALVLAMAFTGYLLPWDQKAFFATAVGTNIMSEVPVVGEGIKRLMRGGTEMGTLTLSRFFVAHVFFIPAFIFLFVAMHVYFFRKAGAAGPPGVDPVHPNVKTESFYPLQVLKDIGFATLLIITLGVVAHYFPTDLGPAANPADTQFVPRPEWYYRPVFQWLRYWQGARAVIGILVIPGIVAVLLTALPFIDRNPERRPWRRPISVGIFAMLMLGLIALGMISYNFDRSDPGIKAQLEIQRRDTEKFTQEPFQPELSAASLAAAASVAVADPLIIKGKGIFEAQACSGCHGDGGIGTTVGPKLIGIGAKFPPDKLAALLKQPTEKMAAGGMSPVEAGADEMKALIAYLNSLK